MWIIANYWQVPSPTCQRQMQKRTHTSKRPWGFLNPSQTWPFRLQWSWLILRPRSKHVAISRYGYVASLTKRQASISPFRWVPQPCLLALTLLTTTKVCCLWQCQRVSRILLQHHLRYNNQLSMGALEAWWCGWRLWQWRQWRWGQGRGSGSGSSSDGKNNNGCDSGRKGKGGSNGCSKCNGNSRCDDCIEINVVGNVAVVVAEATTMATKMP